MLYWIFVIAVGSGIGVVVGGGALLWLHESDVTIWDLVRAMLWLVVVLALLAFAVLWWLRRMGAPI